MVVNVLAVFVYIHEYVMAEPQSAFFSIYRMINAKNLNACLSI